MKTIATSGEKKTEKAFLWTWLFGSPFFDLLVLFTAILIKELHISGFQLAVALALKPACSLLSPYWSAIIHRRQDLVKTNLVLANILRYLPFLCFPFYKSTWLFIASIGMYWTLEKGMKPAWMELIKVMIPEGKREKVCSAGLKIKYCSNIIFPIVIGKMLDIQWVSWQWMFFLTALLGIGSTLFLYRLPTLSCSSVAEKYGLSRMIARPWRDVFKLLRSNRAFLRFQIAFFLGGASLVLFHPAVNCFLVIDLDLSYTVISSAYTMIKGVGCIVASSFWVKRFSRFPLLKLSRLVMIFILFFPCFLLFGQVHLLFVYVAYLVYGVMQAGSELIWHLSGPAYAKQESSSVYTSTNLLMVGLRGACLPAIGTYLMGVTSPQAVLIFGSGVILIGIFVVTLFIRKEKTLDPHVSPTWGKEGDSINPV